MLPIRTSLMQKAAVLLATVSMVPVLQAQTWPDKPVRFVVPYAAGGTTDFTARLIAQKLSEQTGNSFFVENRAGGASTIGTQAVVRSAPDGTTFLTNDTAYAMLPALFKQLPWDHEHDLIPITTLVHTPVVLTVPEHSPFKTLQDLVDAAKSSPGKLNFGTGGAGSSAHLQAALFNRQAGLDIPYIPFKGAGEAMVALIAGHVDTLISASPTAIPHIKSGRVRALAITGESRSPLLPDVPTFAEAGQPEYTVTNWFGLAAPKGTSQEVIDGVYAQVLKALKDPAIVERLAGQGASPGGLSPSEFAEKIRTEGKVWAEAAQDAGITPN